MSPEEIKDIAEAAAEKAVAGMMFNLGLRVGDEESVLRARALMTHLGKQYDACETVKRHSLKTFLSAIGTVAASIVGYLVMMRGGR